MTAMDLPEIADLRSRLWAAGYRPVPLLGAEYADQKRAGKAPLGNGWPEDARRDPPFCACSPAVAHATKAPLLNK